MRFRGKVAIVTGAGTGIGRAAAILFAREGARVVCANRSVETGEETAATIRAEGNEGLFVPTDVSRADDVARMVDTTMAKFGRVDVLFNNAGVSRGGRIVELDEADWDQVLAVNLKGVFLCTKAVAPIMIRQGGGAIINNASVLAIQSLPGSGAYASAKGGMLSFTRVAALELAAHNIRVNAVVPGSTDTPMMWRNVAPEELAQVWEQVATAQPIQRVADPMEIAQAVLFLASDEASFVVGSALVVDGGLLTKLCTTR